MIITHPEVNLFMIAGMRNSSTLDLITRENEWDQGPREVNHHFRLCTGNVFAGGDFQMSICSVCMQLYTIIFLCKELFGMLLCVV